MSLPATYAILLAAIVLEVVGTSALLASAQFTRPGPSALVVACYGGALLLDLDHLPHDPDGHRLCHLVGARHGADRRPSAGSGSASGSTSRRCSGSR